MKKNKSKKKKWKKVLTGVMMPTMVLASTVLPSIPLISSPIKAEASETISVTQNDSSKKMIESSQLRVWMQSGGRYGIQLKSNGATIFYGQDSAYINIIRSGNFPTGFVGNFPNMQLKSFVVNGTTIEQTRTDGTFDYIFRLSIVNATSQGAYMKAELEMKNLTGSNQNVGASFNIDTMVHGNDQSPFRIVPNGWEAFNNGVQVTAYYRDVFNVTNADSIYLGMYYNQYPMPVSSFSNGQVIYPGDSGAGFYYNLKSVAPYASRKESWIMGMGPRNANPTFNMTAPADNQTFYRGQTLPITGTARDTDIGDTLQVKWAIDGGAENLLTSFTANGSNQSFNYNYTLPSNLTEGWHTLQVWVMDDKGGVSSSNTKQFYINNFVTPDTPAFTNVENDSFTVSFDKKGNVNSTTYELYRVHNGTTVNMGSENSRSETGLTPNTRYQYKVRAKNTSNVYTAYSAVSSIYTLANQPTAEGIDSSVEGKATLNWGANGNPSGTKYHYEIRRASDNVVIKSGDTTSTSVEVTGLPTDVKYKAYVEAINGDNKVTAERYLGEIFQDTTAPNMTLSPSTSAWTNGSVTITANATDSGTGIKNIQLPNGNWISNSSVTSYVVDKNGDYTFKVEDNSGNITTKTISITNIDKETPTATHVVEHVDGDTYKVTLSANDNASGIKSIKLPNGDFAYGNQATFNGTKGETYQFEIEDKAGNKIPYEVKIDVPELTVYQKDDHVKAEWAIDMLEEDVLKQTSFEIGEELPSLTWADGKSGGQSITSEDAFSGSKSLRIENTVSNGNWYQFPSTSGVNSISLFDRKYFPNGTDLSMTFKAKSIVGGTLMPNGDGGWGETITTLSNKIAQNTSKGSNLLKLDTLSGIYLGQHVTVDTDPKTIQAVYQIRGVDTINNTITLSSGLVRNVEAGENLKIRPWRGAWSFNSRYVPGNGEWTTFSVNTRVSNYSDYDVALRGGTFYIGSNSSGVMYLDDIKFGYATKAQLFRGDTKIYEGLLSDYEDREATDKAKPNKVENLQIESREGNIFMGIQKPNDNGTEYEYTVKAISNKGDAVTSEKKHVTVTTGIDGYSYVIDTNASTVPDNTVDTRSEDVQIPINNNGKYYVHIKAIDKAGNVSDVSHIPFQDNSAPTMNLTQNPTSWTSSSVQINVTATDQGLGMKRIKLPNGTWVNGSTATHSVSVNGTYTFVAEDLVGNQTTKSITITNIDTTAPTAPSITNNQEWTKDTPVPVSISAGTDSQSGVKRVEYKLEGATVKGWTTYTGTFSVSNEGQTKITARTVDNLGQLSTEDVSYVRIDKSVPYNTGITIKLKP